jgi:hypothetical protein
MNLNFLKLKNSLLSLGLSATLFCTAGLAGLPVFAEGPDTPEALQTEARAQFGFHDRLTRSELQQRFRRFVTLCLSAHKNGVAVPILPTPQQGVLLLSTAKIGALLGVRENSVQRILRRVGMSPPLPQHLQPRGDSWPEESQGWT